MTKYVSASLKNVSKNDKIRISVRPGFKICISVGQNMCQNKSKYVSELVKSMYQNMTKCVSASGPVSTYVSASVKNIYQKMAKNVSASGRFENMYQRLKLSIKACLSLPCLFFRLSKKAEYLCLVRFFYSVNFRCSK